MAHALGNSDGSLSGTPQRETYYEGLVESAPDAILVVDERGVIELANRQAEQLSGYARTELVGQPIEVLVPDRARSVHPAHRSAYVGDPRTRPMGAGLDLTIRRKDGTEVPVDISLSPLQTERGMVVSVAIRDITERQRAERALQDAYHQLSRSVEKLERHDRDVTLVNEMGDLLQSCLSTEEAHQVISRYGRRLFPADSGAVFTVGSSRSVLESVAAWGSNAPRVEILDRDECWALRRARPYVVEGADDGPVCAHLGAPAPHAYLCVPMMAQGEAFGLLHLRLAAESHDEVPTVIESKRMLALTVAEQLSLALANLSLRESLRHQSVSDPLTGLFNRRHMEDQLAREIARGTRAGQPVGIVAVDVDHFKAVNDELGHGAGDDVLRAVGQTLTTGVRSSDVVCRTGGDEFIVILPGSNIDATRERAQKLREAASSPGTGPDGPGQPVTLSLGVAVFPDHGRTADAVLQAADLALYGAKQAGRDRVNVANGLVPTSRAGG